MTDMAEREYRFEPLTPVDNIEMDVYEDAINYVFDNPDVRNVAISGAYSACKSSVLASCKKKYTLFSKICCITLGISAKSNSDSNVKRKKCYCSGKIGIWIPDKERPCVNAANICTACAILLRIVWGITACYAKIAEAFVAVMQVRYIAA